jgi:hypothetical protein
MKNVYRKAHLHSNTHYTSIHFVWIAIINRNGSRLLYLARPGSKALQQIHVGYMFFKYIGW